jgi:hypothetical protein
MVWTFLEGATNSKGGSIKNEGTIRKTVALFCPTPFTPAEEAEWRRLFSTPAPPSPLGEGGEGGWGERKLKESWKARQATKEDYPEGEH